MASLAPKGYTRLYYYTEKKWGMKILWEKRFKVAQYHEMNDPFELIPFSRTRKQSRYFYDEHVRKYFNQGRGVICFSESWRTILMWSHYAAKHTGMCLGFDVLISSAEKVEYVTALLDDFVNIVDPELSWLKDGTIGKIIRSKYRGWKYEKEWRLPVLLERPIDKVYYRAFDDHYVKLRQVIIGPHNDMTVQDVADAIHNPDQDVEIFRARAAFGKVCQDTMVESLTIKGIPPKVRKNLLLAKLLQEPTTTTPGLTGIINTAMHGEE